MALLSVPEINFMNAEDVQFMIIASSGLQEFMEMSMICSIVLHEVRKNTMFNMHELAAVCSKQVLNQALLRGFNKPCALIIVCLGLDIDIINRN